MTLKHISSVFISGEAEDYSPYEKRDVNDFIYNLVASLLSQSVGIATVVGSGIGDMVVRNSLVYLEENDIHVRALSAIPLPQPYDETTVALEEGRRLRTKVRRDMISTTDAAVFLFGNTKDADGKTVLSDGTREEFEIAKESQCLLVPVGVTGYMAEELWNAQRFDFGSCLGKFLSCPGKAETYGNILNNFEKLDGAIVESFGSGDGEELDDILAETRQVVFNILDEFILDLGPPIPITSFRPCPADSTD